jgi:hypothetical protein
MRNLYTYLITGFISTLFAFSQTTTSAQATRTWVSGVGDDVNPCSRTAPCKTFAGAISKTAAGGEINAIDPGGYGALTITKSITINGYGTMTSILVSGTNGIIINAAATDVINLRNLGLTYGPPGNWSGVSYIAGGQVLIENCTFQNFTTAGINVNLTAAGAIAIKNTTITSGASGAIGINIKTTTSTVSASLNNVQIQTDSIGINAGLNSVATVSNSVVSHARVGIMANNSGVLNTENCVISNNNTGVKSADAASVMRLSNTSIFSNTIGVEGTGKVFSFGNNKVAGNATNLSIPISVLKIQ